MHALFSSSSNLESHCLSVNLICIGTIRRKMVSSLNGSFSQEDHQIIVRYLLKEKKKGLFSGTQIYLEYLILFYKI